MKKLLYATGNQAKLESMRERLKPLGIELLGLREAEAERQDSLQKAGGESIIGREAGFTDIAEDGATPLENARKKAHTYYQIFQRPLFSCDSGLYLEGIPDEEQPGVHVRNIHGKCLTDEEMLVYYSSLAEKYGDLKARYWNAICLVLDKENCYSAMEESMASEPFLITAKPHQYGILKKGFPLDCLSIDIESGKYYYDLAGHELEQLAVEDGFMEFFERHLYLKKY